MPQAGCMLGGACGLCQIRREQAAAGKSAYLALQRQITAGLTWRPRGWRTEPEPEPEAGS